jgi:hypothetical protein
VVLAEDEEEEAGFEKKLKPGLLLDGGLGATGCFFTAAVGVTTGFEEETAGALGLLAAVVVLAEDEEEEAGFEKKLKLGLLLDGGLGAIDCFFTAAVGVAAGFERETAGALALLAAVVVLAEDEEEEAGFEKKLKLGLLLDGGLGAIVCFFTAAVGVTTGFEEETAGALGLLAAVVVLEEEEEAGFEKKLKLGILLDGGLGVIGCFFTAAVAVGVTAGFEGATEGFTATLGAGEAALGLEIVPAVVTGAGFEEVLAF